MVCDGGGRLLYVHRERLHRNYDALGPVEEASTHFTQPTLLRMSLLHAHTTLLALHTEVLRNIADSGRFRMIAPLSTLYIFLIFSSFLPHHACTHKVC